MSWYALLPLVTAISVGMRIMPFLIGPYLRRFTFLHKLSVMLPCCLIIMIGAYTVSETTTFTEAPFGLPDMAAIACVILIQIWLRSIIISMGLGMLIHQFLRMIFFTT